MQIRSYFLLFTVSFASKKKRQKDAVSIRAKKTDFNNKLCIFEKTMAISISMSITIRQIKNLQSKI
jgi:hypothetical protein